MILGIVVGSIWIIMGIMAWFNFKELENWKFNGVYVDILLFLACCITGPYSYIKSRILKK